MDFLHSSTGLTPAISRRWSRPFASSESPRNAWPNAARRVVTERLTTPNPIGAIDVAIDITNEEIGDSLIIRAARVLYQSDPKRVIDWLPESGLSEQTQRAILEPES